MILHDVFRLPPAHPRVVTCVDAMLALAPRVQTGNEIGLLWPYIVSRE